MTGKLFIGWLLIVAAATLVILYLTGVAGYDCVNTNNGVICG